MGIRREARGRSKLGSSISVCEAQVPGTVAAVVSRLGNKAQRPEDCDSCVFLGQESLTREFFLDWGSALLITSLPVEDEIVEIMLH